MATSGNESLYRLITAAIVLLCLGLIAYQFVFNPSLFIDELAVVNSVLARDVASLISQPLDYDQVAPVGFLALIKVASLVMGTSEMALRFFPLVSVLAAIALFFLVARRLFVPAAVPVALAVFCLMRPVIRTPSLVKQYSFDLFVSVALLWIGVQLVRRSRIHPAWLALALLAPWLSQPAAFVLPGLVMTWAWSVRERGESLKPVGMWTALWGASALASVLWARRLVTPETMSYMHGYWESAFWPLWPVSLTTFKWPAAMIRDVVQGPMSLPGAEVGLLVLAVGFFYWVRSKPVVLPLVVAPIALALVASAFGLYPFSGRTLWFVLPSIALLFGAAFEFAIGSLRHRQRIVALTVVVIVVARAAYFLVDNRPPYSFQHIRPIFTQLQAQAKAGDRFLVTYGAEQAWRYYAPRFDLPNESATFMACRRGPVTDQVKDLDGFQAGSGRVWLVFSLEARSHSPDLLVDALSRRGALVSELHSTVNDPTVSAHLFDLNAPPSIAPDRAPFVVTEVNPSGPCRGPAIVRAPIP